MYDVSIKVLYQMDQEHRSLAREARAGMDDELFIVPEVVSVPRAVEMLDHLYLEVRNDLLGHLDPESHALVPEVSYILVKKGHAGE
jgi:hypothetical protein